MGGPAPSRALRREFAKQCRVVLVNEYFTSKHSVCHGAAVTELPASGRRMKCTHPGCGLVMDRDLMGAKNIERVW